MNGAREQKPEKKIFMKKNGRLPWHLKQSAAFCDVDIILRCLQQWISPANTQDMKALGTKYLGIYGRGREKRREKGYGPDSKTTMVKIK